LIDYSGHHLRVVDTTQPDAPQIDRHLLNWIIRYHLRCNEVVLLLDGLDEITVTVERDQIVHEIDNFINMYVPAVKVVQFQAGASAVISDESEFYETGNQVIITGRIIGYSASHLKGDLAHVTIEMKSFGKLQKIAIEQNTSFEDLCVYALQEAQKVNEKKKDAAKKRMSPEKNT
jgi:hypothetical protein